MKVLAIYGAGGLGREIIDLAKAINKHDDRWNKMVFVDDISDMSEVAGLNVFKLDVLLEVYSSKSIEFIIALGGPAFRENVFHKLSDKNLKMATLIHPTVQIGDRTIIHDGCIIQYNCFISCDVELGYNVLLQPSSNVGHNTHIGDHSVLSSFVCVAGNCNVGNSVYVGMNVPIKEGITIGDKSIVGMGSCVLRDIPDGVVALGNPARAMKENDSYRVFKSK